MPTNNLIVVLQRRAHAPKVLHFIRDQVKKGTVEVKYCGTEDMVADIFRHYTVKNLLN